MKKLTNGSVPQKDSQSRSHGNKRVNEDTNNRPVRKLRCYEAVSDIPESDGCMEFSTADVETGGE